MSKTQLAHESGRAAAEASASFPDLLILVYDSTRDRSTWAAAVPNISFTDLKRRFIQCENKLEIQSISSYISRNRRMFRFCDFFVSACLLISRPCISTVHASVIFEDVIEEIGRHNSLKNHDRRFQMIENENKLIQLRMPSLKHFGEVSCLSSLPVLQFGEVRLMPRSTQGFVLDRRFTSCRMNSPATVAA